MTYLDNFAEAFEAAHPRLGRQGHFGVHPAVGRGRRPGLPVGIDERGQGLVGGPALAGPRHLTLQLLEGMDIAPQPLHRAPPGGRRLAKTETVAVLANGRRVVGVGLRSRG